MGKGTKEMGILDQITCLLRNLYVGRRITDQIANIHWITEKASEFCFIDYAKAFDCVGHNKLWKIL